MCNNVYQLFLHYSVVIKKVDFVELFTRCLRYKVIIYLHVHKIGTGQVAWFDLCLLILDNSFPVLANTSGSHCNINCLLKS